MTDRTLHKDAIIIDGLVILRQDGLGYIATSVLRHTRQPQIDNANWLQNISDDSLGPRGKRMISFGKRAIPVGTSTRPSRIARRGLLNISR